MAENEGNDAPEPTDSASPKSDTAAPASTTPRPAAAAANRDVPLSTFVHLLGLSTSNQVSVLESKVDALTAKLAGIVTKVERIAADVGEIKGDAAVDRIDFQLNDIRTLLKKIAPAIVAGAGAAAAAGAASGEGDPKSPASRAKVLKSEAPKPETKIVEKDNLEELARAADDEAYQAAEGQRVRNQTKEGA